MNLFKKKKSSIDKSEILSISTLQKEIEILLETKINPQVAMHGGSIEFREWDADNGILYLFLKGACSGCSMSSETLKMGVENMIKHYFPEVKLVEGIDDPNSDVGPYYELCIILIGKSYGQTQKGNLKQS